MNRALTLRERRIGKRLAARGDAELFTRLIELCGAIAGGAFRLESLYAVGGEGAVYLTRDLRDPSAPIRVSKVALAPWHTPHQLSSALIAQRRQVLVDEEALLRTCGSPFLPQSFGLWTFRNPHLESARGGEFTRGEPCLVLEKLPGHDLDVWLCRVHRGRIDRDVLRPHLDRLAVGLLQAMVDLHNRGFLYADLRPGNLRVVGRPKRRVRVLDAGGCVAADGSSDRFPHVPSYLPPQSFTAMQQGRRVNSTAALEAAMAGRTLYEVATGQAPKAGAAVDMMRLLRSPVSPPVAEIIAALAAGDHPHCASALAALAGRAKRRVAPKS
ncbi:MAG: hypothetical protein K8T90_21815 [Planctomycetes bacterium]|nr:hypothetical protein [Planctomycetota bacterium]